MADSKTLLKSMYSMISDVSADEPVGMIAEKASAGAIMGARGNSGVILSQIIHGISRGLRGKKTASGTQMGKAFQYGILYAYRAVTKPVEGTILSVARGIATFNEFQSILNHLEHSNSRRLGINY